jgi:predicted flavoprotein YhiN
MPEPVDIAIIGGGAAGLAAAIFAAQSAEPPYGIVVIDGAKTLGAKILVAGGGRCNVTHDVVTPADFNGSKNVVRNILAAFDAPAAVRWFASLGVELKREETGKLFPVTDSARTVLLALLRRCGELGVKIMSGCKVTGIRPPVLPEQATDANADRGADSNANRAARSSVNPNFTITYEGGQVQPNRIIMATGGRTLPRSGSDGSGWEIIRQLGHTVTPTFAALAPLVLDAKMFHAELAGIAQEVELSTFVEGQLVDRRAGSMLWTHFGISGPVVMDASRFWIIAAESGKSAKMQCNFFPGSGFEAIEKSLMDLATSRGKMFVVNAITGGLVGKSSTEPPENAKWGRSSFPAGSEKSCVPISIRPEDSLAESRAKPPEPSAPRTPERVALALLRLAGIDPAVTCGQLSRDARRALVHTLVALPLPIQQHRGWNYAEVTAGGVPLNEIDYRTMQSRKVPGLYLAGEMLDCDGRIGGFNFQWAWATGFLAGRAAGKFSGRS